MLRRLSGSERIEFSVTHHYSEVRVCGTRYEIYPIGSVFVITERRESSSVVILRIVDRLLVGDLRPRPGSVVEIFEYVVITSSGNRSIESGTRYGIEEEEEFRRSYGKVKSGRAYGCWSVPITIES